MIARSVDWRIKSAFADLEIVAEPATTWPPCGAATATRAWIAASKGRVARSRARRLLASADFRDVAAMRGESERALSRRFGTRLVSVLDL
jgi:hypothetical protein